MRLPLKTVKETHGTAHICCWVLCCDRVLPQSDCLWQRCSCAAAARQTDGQTPHRCIDPAPHTTRALPTIAHNCKMYMYIQVGPKKQAVLRVDNFATVSDSKACDVKTFLILSRKKYKTWMSLKLNILCLVCINIQCSWNVLNLMTMHEFYPIFNSNSESNKKW